MKLRGFTLIELLVVISIIGLLASIVLTALGGARAKGVNARISTDINQYQNALELYYSKWGSYPVPPSVGVGGGFVCLGNYGGTNSSPCWQGVQTEDTAFDALITPYISGPPTGQTVSLSGHTFLGYLYKCTAGSGTVCTKYVIYWMMNGTNQVCTGQNGIHNDQEDFNSWGLMTECQLAVSS